MAHGDQHEQVLPVALTDEEVARRSDLLANAVAERDEHDDERKVVLKRLNDERGRIETRISKLAEEVRTKSEDTLVEVVQRANHGEGVMEYVRTDTGDVIRTRQLTDDERQRPLPMGGAAAAKEEA